jgi:flagellar motility protein MotE (MotC chaperone)
MSAGYDNFFKQARQVKQKAGKSKRPATSMNARKRQQKNRRENSLELAAKQMAVKKNKKQKSRFPVGALLSFVVLLSVSVAAFLNWEMIEQHTDRIQIGLFGKAMAEAEDAEKKDVEKTKPEDSAQTAEEGEGTKTIVAKSWTDEEVALFAKLQQRKKELDLREQELQKLEEELHKQKEQLDKRMRDLASVRQEIADQLQVQVDVDEDKVNKLVNVYSNMKPANAAKVFSELNEDLAVEVLGKMKKKNAADIMNYLSSEKSRRLSEKYTGYKKR